MGVAMVFPEAGLLPGSPELLIFGGSFIQLGSRVLGVLDSFGDVIGIRQSLHHSFRLSGHRRFQNAADRGPGRRSIGGSLAGGGIAENSGKCSKPCARSRVPQVVELGLFKVIESGLFLMLIAEES
jgi:hypothetical protein